MNSHRKFIAVVASLIATLCVSGASADNGMQTYAANWTKSWYAACLGETVEIKNSATVSYHDFITPSGKVHLLEHIEYTSTYTGLITGWVWYSRAVSTFEANIGPGEIVQWVERFMAKPVTGDGPKFKFLHHYKGTVNANGDLVVDMYSFDGVDPAEFFVCIGKN